jgi:hypothetical protein
MKLKALSFFPMLLFLVCSFTPGKAQEQGDEELTIRLNRDFGFALGSQIQGTFTIQVSGPPDLMRVEFLIDGQRLGADTEAPFQIRFNTGSFSNGNHTLAANGYTQNGRELHSRSLTIQFVSPDQGWRTGMRIVLPLLALILGAIVLSAVVPLVFGQRQLNQLPLGAPRNYGFAGGAICPKCGRSFGMHIFGLNLAIGKWDRCPYCGRWSLVRRASPQQLAEAEAAELRMASGEVLAASLSEEEKLKKSLEDSRFQDL